METILFQFSAIDLSARGGSARMVSVAAHVAVIFLALIFVTVGPATRQTVPTIGDRKPRTLLEYVRPETAQGEIPSLGKDTGGGLGDRRPTTTGKFAPRSSKPIVPPRQIVNANPELPAPPAVFDANAPENVPVITDLGLPTMKAETNSAGPGSNKGFGPGHNGGMGPGDQPGAGVGVGVAGTGRIVSRVMCAYCPEPAYTEEARKAKLQGGVTVDVLVGADGRAKEVRVLKGLGMGLDESATAAVRAWRFTPAMDGQRRPIPTWVTVETRFQLF